MSIEAKDILSIQMPKYVGLWRLPGSTAACRVEFASPTKPNWFHRFMMKTLLGWEWRDL